MGDEYTYKGVVMKRLYFFLTLLVVASADRMLQAMSDEDDGGSVGKYVALGIAGAGAVGAGAKLYGRYQAGRTKEASKQAKIKQQLDSFDTTVNAFKVKIYSKHEELRNKFISFLKSSTDIREIFHEEYGRFQELIVNLEEMKKKLGEVAVSDMQRSLLKDADNLLNLVRLEQEKLKDLEDELDSYSVEFMKGIEGDINVCLKVDQPVPVMNQRFVYDDEESRPYGARTYRADDRRYAETRLQPTARVAAAPTRRKASFEDYEDSAAVARRDDRRNPVVGSRHYPARDGFSTSRLEIDSLTLPVEDKLIRAATTIQTNYQQFVAKYEELRNRYNTHYGSFFAKLKGYLWGSRG